MSYSMSELALSMKIAMLAMEHRINVTNLYFEMNYISGKIMV